MDKKEKQTTVKKVEKNVNELVVEIREKKKKVQDLKLDLRMGKLKNPREISILKKEIARLQTKLSLQKFIKE